jgi:hypothetical protein
MIATAGGRRGSGDLSRKSLCALKKNDSRCPNWLTSSPASIADWT